MTFARCVMNSKAIAGCESANFASSFDTSTAGVARYVHVPLWRPARLSMRCLRPFLVKKASCNSYENYCLGE